MPSVSAANTASGFPAADLSARAVKVFLSPIQGLIAAPSLVYVSTLALMLFHSPDFHFYSLDRIAFAVLVSVVALRICMGCETLRLSSLVTWPLLGLILLALWDALQAHEVESWSLFAAKWLLPFIMYQVAPLVFNDDRSWRRFETVSLVILAYLSVIAICFLAGAKYLVFPRYILDEGIGYHADRARGPFLQAVANGVSLNLLGLIALNSFRTRRLRGLWGLLLLAAVPLAIVATKTRAVWLSFAASIVILLFVTPSRRVRRACLAGILATCAGLGVFLASTNRNDSLSERLEESGPVKFRFEVYEAGWGMFLGRPLMGWGSVAMTDELDRRISDFQQEHFYFHNTYLEILVQYGLLGLGLYIWLVIDLFRLGRGRYRLSEKSFADRQFQGMWPLLLGVYLVNGLFVVMNYQFVNGYLFTLAGVLAGQDHRQDRTPAPVTSDRRRQSDFQ